MTKNPFILCLLIFFATVLFLSCRKDGLNSPTAKKIQYKWERISYSSMIDYLDGRPTYWTVNTAAPGNYLEFKGDGYMYKISGTYATKYEYKVSGNEILSLLAGNDRFTTPQYTDTVTVKQVDDHLLVLTHKSYYISGAYAYTTEYLDSLKK